MQKQTSIADIVAGQFPFFVQEDYATFIAFMEAYYTFLDKQKLTRSLESIKDVDNALDEFIQLIKREIAPEIPVTNKFFLSNSKKFHLSRGSEESYRTLFRLLLKKEIDILYPADKMLRVSDGQWQQDISFFIKVTAGDPFSLQNDFLLITTAISLPAPRRIKVFVKKVQQVETALDIYEVFIARNYFGTLAANDVISYKGVSAKIVPTTSRVKIVQAGAGFKIGQVFNITTPTASGMLAKVTKTTEEGGISRLQIVAFGVGYPRDFFFDITGQPIGQSAQGIFNKKISQTDTISNNSDYGVINSYDYHGDYVDGNYVGEILGDFYSATSSEESTITIARLRVELGALAVYPGFYASSRSLIDDDSYIQDGEYYQDFSYVIRLDEKLTTYKDAVLSILHPAGRKMFGEFLIDSAFNLSMEISNPLIRILIPQYSESDESLDVLDRTVWRVIDNQFIGDGVTSVWQLLDEFSKDEVLVTHIKVNENYYPYGLDYEFAFIDDGKIVFFSAPPAGAVIKIRYIVRRYTEDTTGLQDTFFDLRKTFNEEFNFPDDDVDTKHVHKIRNSAIESINSFGYLHKNPYQAYASSFFAEDYLLEEITNF